MKKYIYIYICMCIYIYMLKPPPSDTLQGINLSHLGKFGKSSSNYLPRRGICIVPRRVHLEDFIISSKISPRRFAFCQVTSLEGDVEEQWHAQHLDDMEMFKETLNIRI